MNDRAWEFLEKTGVIILPEDLDHEVYIVIQTACVMYAQRRLYLFCRGDGGSSRTANAIVDAVRGHGNVCAVLAGEANSSHGVIFAGCPHRYVYPNAALGVHRTVLNSMEIVDSAYAKYRFEDLDQSNRMTARVLASACPLGSQFNEEWWYGQIEEAGRGLRMFSSTWLIQNQMAKSVTEILHELQGLI